MLSLKKSIKRMTQIHSRPTVYREVQAGDVGYQDAMNNGWFNVDSGELSAGFQISPSDVVIDVGCGDGGLSTFAGKMGAAVIATDISAKCVETTRQRVSDTKARSFEGVVSASNPLPIPDATGTRIVCSEVMEHVPDPKSFIQELVRIAKPGALFLLTVPDEASEDVQRDLAPPSYWAEPNHIRIFRGTQFDELVKGAGLEIVNKHQRSFFWSMWWSLFWAADQNFGEPQKPVLYHWSATWDALIQSEGGRKIAKRLDLVMPKSQAIVARKLY